MKDFEIRLVKEFKELYDRLDKLTQFVGSNPKFKELSPEMQSAMERQGEGMVAYMDALCERLSMLGLTGNEDVPMSFGEAIVALEQGHAVQREGWNGKGLFIVKQIPAKIEGLIIDKIQSLPQSCKDLLKEREGVPHIDYTNQMLIINPDGRADSWVASSSDTFAHDWHILR